VIEELIREGHKLLERVEREYDGSWKDFPTEQRVSEAELKGWYTGIQAAVDLEFGAASREAEILRSGLERVGRDSWEGVGRVSPVGGSWVIHNLLESLGLLAQVRLVALHGGATGSDTSQGVKNLLGECGGVVANQVYAEDLLTSLRELHTCFDNGCYIACLALCGKLLEIALKQLLLDYNVTFDDRMMIGQLLKTIREANIPKYVDPSLREIGEIINRSRIPAVHAKESIPVPSREQAAMVINALIDTIRRTIVSR
jgi:hypothetical protein